MPRRKIAPEVKAAATAAALAGGSTRSIARRYAVSHQAVHLWRKYPYGQQKSEQINARVFRLVLEGLDALAAHYIATRDADWIARQSAADLALYDGMAHDRLLGLVEAIRAAGERRDPPALPDAPVAATAPPDAADGC